MVLDSHNPALRADQTIIVVFYFAVLVRRGRDNKAQLVLLDHGLYEYLSQR